jgi:hypothetical protein
MRTKNIRGITSPHMIFLILLIGCTVVGYFFFYTPLKSLQKEVEYRKNLRIVIDESLKEMYDKHGNQFAVVSVDHRKSDMKIPELNEIFITRTITKLLAGTEVKVKGVSYKDIKLTDPVSDGPTKLRVVRKIKELGNVVMIVDTDPTGPREGYSYVRKDQIVDE